MTLGEELRRKYALTSLKAKGAPVTLLAINEALEAAAGIADQEHSPIVACRIRSLKWTDKMKDAAPRSIRQAQPARIQPAPINGTRTTNGCKQQIGPRIIRDLHAAFSINRSTFAR